MLSAPEGRLTSWIIVLMVREGRPSWEVWLLDSKVTPRRFTRVLVWPQIRSQCFLAKAFSKNRPVCLNIPHLWESWVLADWLCRCSGTWKACVPCCVFQDKRKTFMECLHLFYCWFWDRVSQVVQVSLNLLILHIQPPCAETTSVRLQDHTIMPVCRHAGGTPSELWQRSPLPLKTHEQRAVVWFWRSLSLGWNLSQLGCRQTSC